MIKLVSVCIDISLFYLVSRREADSSPQVTLISDYQRTPPMCSNTNRLLELHGMLVLPMLPLQVLPPLNSSINISSK